MSIDSGPHDLNATRMILGPSGEARLKQTGPDFYEALGREIPDFTGHLLIQQGDFAEPWGVWEMHPVGDEFVYLLSGDVEFTLKAPGEEPSTLRLDQPGLYVVVPRGVWHTVTPRIPSSMLFVTPGQGTRNELEPED